MTAIVWRETASRFTTPSRESLDAPPPPPSHGIRVRYAPLPGGRISAPGGRIFVRVALELEADGERLAGQLGEPLARRVLERDARHLGWWRRGVGVRHRQLGWIGVCDRAWGGRSSCRLGLHSPRPSPNLI